MSVNKEAKGAALEEIKDKLSRAKSMVLIDYKGLTVAEVTKLRSNCRAAGVDYKVFKNTLVAKVASELKVEGLAEHLEGTNAFAFSYDDVVAPAKILFEFIKDNNKGEIKCGLMEGKYMPPAEVEALAKLPGKDALIVKLIWTLQGNLRNLAYALNAIKDKKEA